jgi:hypothetical protein
MSKIPDTLPADVVETRNLIRNWRATRRPGSAMPDGLWAAAVHLAQKHGLYIVSRTLPIDYGALKKRLETNGGVCGPAFVELAPMTLPQAAPLDGSIIEIINAEGGRMTVRLPVGAAIDLAGLVSAFQRRAS